jgi:hypothetical protein
MTLAGIRYRILSESQGPYVTGKGQQIDGIRFMSVTPC